MEIIEVIGFTAGIFVAISSFPQFLKSLKTKSTKDVAFLWLLINILGQILWIGYGFLKDSVSLVVMSFITLIMVSAVLFLKIKYG